MLVVVHFQPGWELELRYERAEFTSNLWQSVTHALVHLNTQHLVINCLALFCIYLLFPEGFKSTKWIIALLVSAIVSSAGLYLFSPAIDWCVGLSGALHGLMVYVMLRARANVLWMLALAGKIILEQTTLSEQFDVANLTANLIQHNVVVDAHLWGAIGGLLFFGIVRSVTMISVIVEINRSNGENSHR